MQYTGPRIQEEVEASQKAGKTVKILIEPFDEKCVGSNSYDLHLSKTLRVYKSTLPNGMRPAIEYVPGKTRSMRDWFYSDADFERYKAEPWYFDPRNPEFMLDPFDKKKEFIEIELPENGVILSPAIGYLGSTAEYTETYNLFPYIDGKSSVGRNFILTHHTAGRGDDGFCGQWTLELATQYPTLLAPGMRIGQIYYEEFLGSRKPYDKNPGSHYNNQRGPTIAAGIPIEPNLGGHQR